MLHGRKPLMLKMPVNKGCVWVDLGGGTASNVEYFSKSISKDWFSAVYVVDLTPSLVKVAKKRVEDNNWGSKVQIVLGDATDPNLEGLPAAGTCDVVSISYAVTMIPNWEDVLKNAYRLLKPGGHICVCDFTVDPVRSLPFASLAPDERHFVLTPSPSPSLSLCLSSFVRTVRQQLSQWSASQSFWKYLFSTDHIYLNEAHITTLQSMFEQTHLEMHYGTFPYVPPLLKCPYYAFIGKKK